MLSAVVTAVNRSLDFVYVRSSWLPWSWPHTWTTLASSCRL